MICLNQILDPANYYCSKLKSNKYGLITAQLIYTLGKGGDGTNVISIDT
jgi:hypothetical protein